MISRTRLSLTAALFAATSLAGCNSSPNSFSASVPAGQTARAAALKKVAAAQPAAPVATPAADRFDFGGLFAPPENAAPPAPAVAAAPEAAGPRAANEPKLDQSFSAIYGEQKDGAFTVPAVKAAHLNPAFVRKKVAYETSEPAGSIVIDPAAHYLYYIEGGGMATRYGVGVGREGFVWSGSATIKNKQEWPDWYPPKEMIERRPDLQGKMSKLQSGEGMHGGPNNPLGARAMYLWQGDKDTLFRIHGTNEPWSIGHSESSGCVRMINQDVIDLYNKVQPGAKVVVLGSRGARPVEALLQRPDEKGKKKVAAR
ncbi:MAG: L,D-transpeptidase [Methylocystis sp.]|nr:L,D-transpeptidase [Methylocystis sp.]